MRKILSFLFVLLFITASVHADVYDVYEAMEKSAVKIFSLGSGLGSCSGVLIKETPLYSYVLTCKHCTGTYEEVYVENKKVILVIESAHDDLALFIVKGEFTNRDPVKLAARDPQEGDYLYHLGYPLYEEYYSEGFVDRTTDDWQWAYVPVIGGCSGGGFFNIDGELVGIVWGGIDAIGLSVYEPISDIVDFFKEIEDIVGL